MDRVPIVKAHRAIRAEYDALAARYELLSLLRTKPLTVGQALDITDVILEQKDVPIPLVLGIMEQESVFRAEAVSDKGARGLMQLMPLVWQTYSDHAEFRAAEWQIHEASMNVRVGLRYLSDLKKEFGDWKRVLRAYVGGPQRAEDPAMDDYANAVLRRTALYEKEVKLALNSLE